MAIETGDTVHIKRGKHTGPAKVTAVQADPLGYVLQLPDGTFVVQAATNVKAPTEPTITLTELAAILNANDDLGGIKSDLVTAFPGLADKI